MLYRFKLKIKQNNKLKHMSGHKKTVPTNKPLYDRIKSKVKKRVKVWPSAYASGQVVSEYKRAGGGYKKATKKGKG